MMAMKMADYSPAVGEDIYGGLLSCSNLKKKRPANTLVGWGNSILVIVPVIVLWVVKFTSAPSSWSYSWANWLLAADLLLERTAADFCAFGSMNGILQMAFWFI